MVAGLGSMIDPTYSVSAKIRVWSLFVCLEFESEFILYEYALLLYDSITGQGSFFSSQAWNKNYECPSMRGWRVALYARY